MCSSHLARSKAVFWLALAGIFFARPFLLQSQETIQPPSGTIQGTVVDSSGAPVDGAQVTISEENQPTQLEAKCDNSGNFTIEHVPPGPYLLVVTAPGLAPQTVSGIAMAGQSSQVPNIVMKVATLTTSVNVTLTPVEIAEEQIQAEEKQRLFGFLPNYYVTYEHFALPLNAKQKFELAWKTIVDPVSFGVTAAIAGVQQLQNDFKAYGQGAEGYGKRYAASYADFVSGTMISGAILPSLLKQDPRYFYKGTGSKKSRFLYAIANAVICKGDNGKWQPNYSGILGSLAAGGISNLYYPAADRGAGLVFENASIGIAESAAGNVIQEFFFKKLTPHANGN